MARNRYAGTCYKCGVYVPAGYGHFERIHGQSFPKWRIHCVKCASGRIVTDDDPCVKAVRRELQRWKEEQDGND